MDSVLFGQIPGGPPVGELGAVAQVLTAVAFLIGAVGWFVLKMQERKDFKKNGSSNRNTGTYDLGPFLEQITEVGGRLAEFQGRISERTTLHGEMLEAIRSELASRPWHKSVSEATAVVAAAEERLNERLSRLEKRVDEMPAKRR